MTAHGTTSLLATAADGDGDALVVVILVAPAHGALELSPDGSFRYVHHRSETTARRPPLGDHRGHVLHGLVFGQELERRDIHMCWHRRQAWQACTCLSTERVHCRRTLNAVP